MKWVDHKRLISMATRYYHVPSPTYAGLMSGVIYPDKTNNWRRDNNIIAESHHNPSADKILGHVWKARRHWINGDENNAGFQLGCALHYIHDGFAGKGFLELFHDKNENEINTLAINTSFLESAMNDSKSDPFFVERLVHDVSPKDPKDALNDAAYASLAIIKSVLNHQQMPSTLEEKYTELAGRHERFRGAVAIGCILTLAMGFVVSPLIGFFLVNPPNRCKQQGI